jgi:hypothetical protein
MQESGTIVSDNGCVIELARSARLPAERIFQKLV